MRKKTWLAILVAAVMLCALLPVAALAADGDNTFFVGKVRYLITDTDTVSVISDRDDSFAGVGVGQATYTGEINIKETVEDHGKTYRVTEISKLAFFNTEVTKVSLPSSIKKIGEKAFYSCKNLTEISLKSGLLEIGSMAFEQCSQLSVLEIPSTVEKIGVNAFGGCDKLTSLTIPAGVKDGLVPALVGNFPYPHLDKIKLAEGSPYEIEGGVLYKGTVVQLYMGSEEHVVVREGTTGIASQQTGEFASSFGWKGAFSQNTTLKSVKLPNTITHIPDYAFYQAAGLENVALPEGVTSIGNSAFSYNAMLKTVVLPEGLISIGNRAFYGNSMLKTVVLPEGLTSIGEYAFSNNPMLEYINIPSTVESIGQSFLQGGLKPDGGTTIISQVTNPSVFTPEALRGFRNKKPTILYPAEAEAAYRASGLSSYLPSPGSPDEDQTAYALNIPATLSLDVNQSTSLTAACKVPQGTRLVVSPSDPTVVRVDPNGTITGIKSGSATVTVSIATSGGITLDTKTCTVTVNHVHAPAKTEAAAPTCAQNGHTAYWYCADCQKYFADAACTQEIALADTVIPAAGAHQYQNGLCTVCGARDTSTPPAAQPPKTGDDSRLALWTLLLIAAAIGLAGAALYRKGKATR